MRCWFKRERHTQTSSTSIQLLAAAVFAHGMAEFRDEGLAEFGEHDGDDEWRQWSEHERRVTSSKWNRTPVRASGERDPVCGSADWLVAGEFGDGFFRAVIVDEGLASGGGGDERGDGGIVERTRQAEAGFVEPGDGIVGEEWIGPPDQRQEVA